MPIEKRPRRTYTDEFKNQVVQLYKNGKRKCDIKIIKTEFVKYSTFETLEELQYELRA